ncbi:hypothetical protein I7I50_05912 [Histoplasma capsulatum G186AR]|nr:hypothetical protein I7I52_04171 [Histoplasma capsulatum]QSS76452.1 hypothetical protein I7I50_05912 [Histoplasma capsulatum G186AR]
MLVRYVTLDKGHWQMQQHKSYVLCGGLTRSHRSSVIDPQSSAISHQSISNSEKDRQTPDKIELPLQAIRSRYGPKPPKPPSRPDGVGMGNPRGRVTEVATADRSF